MINIERYQNLRLFLTAYFHQDWDDHWGTPQNAVKEFAQKRSAEQLDVVIREIDALRAEVIDEGQLAEILFEDLGCNYYSESYRDWLLWLRHALKALAKEKR
jgi:hypothetical protein